MIKHWYRKLKLLVLQLLGKEPNLIVGLNYALEFHGTVYGGWNILKDSLSQESVVVDLGLGEDISFSESLIDTYGCRVYGFDPTPRSIAYVNQRKNKLFFLYEYGVAAESGEAIFYLPNNAEHISGSLQSSFHLGENAISVRLIGTGELLEKIGVKSIDLLKMDVEGAEYGIINSKGFPELVKGTKQVLIEFHHRWPGIGKSKTIEAVKKMNQMGYGLAWVSETNQEALFIRNHSV